VKKLLLLVLGAIFLISGTALAQNLIDFEEMAIDVLADGIYQENTPFFPGVLIETVDNLSCVITGWPVVVIAHKNRKDCGLGLPDPPHVPAFNSNVCGPLSTNNFPIFSGWHSLSDTSEGLWPSAGTPRKQDGFLILFDYPVKDFSLSVADWGDYFPNPDIVEGFPSYILLVAYDEGGNVISSFEGDKLEAATPEFDSSKTKGIITLPVEGSGIREVEIRFMGKIDPGVTIDYIEFTGDLNVDIKPGDNPNCFNSNGHGVIPLAILGSEEFDVTIIDPFSVELDGQPVRVKGKSGKAGSYEDVNDDGFIDLIVQIEDLGIYTPEHTTGKVTAETYDSVFFEGQDTICITQ